MSAQGAKDLPRKISSKLSLGGASSRTSQVAAAPISDSRKSGPLVPAAARSAVKQVPSAAPFVFGSDGDVALVPRVVGEGFAPGETVEISKSL